VQARYPDFCHDNRSHQSYRPYGTLHAILSNTTKKEKEGQRLNQSGTILPNSIRLLLDDGGLTHSGGVLTHI